MTTERVDRPTEPPTVSILVNGVERPVRPDTTLQELAVALGIAAEPRGVAIALDGLVVPRSGWTETTVIAGARVEVVRAGAGG